MAWTVASGPHDPGASGKDAIGWGWVIARDGDDRHVTVYVSGTVMASASEQRSSDANAAIETKGRSEVDRLLGDEDPPRIITLTSSGRTVGQGG